MGIKTLGVVGAGQMGSGIVQVAAISGLSVVMNDIKDEFVEGGFATIEKSLDNNAELVICGDFTYRGHYFRSAYV